MRPSLGSLTWLATTVLFVACTLELGVFVALRSGTRVYRDGQAFPIPSGYQLDKRYLGETPASCYVIRVTADGCPYCKRDKGQYQYLAQQAQQAGCQVVDLGPRVGGMALRPDGPVQLQYVDMKWGQTLNPFLTPQTILLDRTGRMQWQRQGSMSDRDLDAAMKSLGSLR